MNLPGLTHAGTRPGETCCPPTTAPPLAASSGRTIQLFVFYTCFSEMFSFFTGHRIVLFLNRTF